jgi:hypothetical protein
VKIQRKSSCSPTATRRARSSVWHASLTEFELCELQAADDVGGRQKPRDRFLFFAIIAGGENFTWAVSERNSNSGREHYHDDDRSERRGGLDMKMTDLTESQTGCAL